ncbi:MAG: sigma-70 family RNA polymerase sigma factor [Myxococcaceae bacterium]|nr:sigma-70 family RNA polymerase sigma factor [Myxococcaceae bacterium]
MESFDHHNIDAAHLETANLEPTDLAAAGLEVGEDVEQNPEVRSASRDRERQLSVQIEQRLSSLYAAIVEFDLAFSHLETLVKGLDSGELRLRSVVDVSGDFEASSSDGADAEEAHPGSRRISAALRKFSVRRRAWKRMVEGERKAARRDELIHELQELSLHPQQLRAIHEHVGEKVSALTAAERALRTALKLRVAPEHGSAKAWRSATRGKRVAKSEGVKEALDTLSQLEREAGEPLAAFKLHGFALREAHHQLEVSKSAMVQAHLYLVHRMAKRYAGRGIDLTDLMQEGAVGLMRAVDRFDWRRGLRFATYANWWIRASFTRTLAEQSRTIRLPVNVGEHLLRMWQVSSALAQKLGREPQLEETAEAAGITPEKAERLLASQRPVVSLDEPLDDEGENTIMDRIADSTAADPAKPTERTELEQLLGKALAQLPEKERHVLERRFGFGDDAPETLEEIGRSFGLSRERVRQIEARALQKLRRLGTPLELHAYLSTQDEAPDLLH